ncbi:hypothetical protein PL11_005005 [Lentilactobacillus curieae]|uniref:Uncharacterized protein n=1 Tax=Lentilactobacillus curieae TaxID=1138822 RepID=A0A1S6QIA4_9LACO|nr:hypothetical protein [Lentilactobacillus curieae]AQW21331.1 hypothetical protein PL11_005005 [Lentilactobacillus curieae]
MAETKTESTFLNVKMNEAFDWSDSSEPVRDALWDYYMEKNERDTNATEKDMHPYMSMSEDDIKSDVEKLLHN